MAAVSSSPAGKSVSLGGDRQIAVIKAIHVSSLVGQLGKDRFLSFLGQFSNLLLGPWDISPSCTSAPLWFFLGEPQACCFGLAQRLKLSVWCRQETRLLCQDAASEV